MYLNLCKVIHSSRSHMKLKKYQRTTLEELQKYILEMRKYDTKKAAGVAFMIMRTDAQDNFPKDYHGDLFVA